MLLERVLIDDIFLENKILRLNKMFLSVGSKYRHRNDVDQYCPMNDTLFLIGLKKAQENPDKNDLFSENFSQIAIE